MSQGLLEYRSPEAVARLHGGAVLEVFLHMLLSADGNGNYTLESARTMSKHLDLSERTVFRALKRLEAEGYITTLDGVTTNYRSAMRKINDLEMWPARTLSPAQRRRQRDRLRKAKTGGSDNSGQNEGKSPDSVSFPLDVSYISNYLLLTSNYQLDSTNPVVRERGNRVDHLPVASAEGIQIVARSRKFVDPDEGCDPFSAGLDDEPAPPPESSEARKIRIEANRKAILANREKSKNRLGPAQEMAVYFKAHAADSDTFGGTNVTALAARFAAWVREGADYPMIRKLIDGYWAEDFPRSRSTAPWKDFLNRKDEVRAQQDDRELLAAGADPFAGFKWN